MLRTIEASVAPRLLVASEALRGRTDGLLFVIWSLAAVLSLLLLLFRRVFGFLLPLILVLVSLVSTIGMMVPMGIPYSMPLNMVPIFLICVGVCNSVHILVIVYQRLALGDTREDAPAPRPAPDGLFDRVVRDAGHGQTRRDAQRRQ